MRYYSSEGSLILRGSRILLVGTMYDGVGRDLDPIHVFNLMIALVMAMNYLFHIYKVT